jgi:hypothetical protein
LLSAKGICLGDTLFVRVEPAEGIHTCTTGLPRPRP